VKDRGLRIHTTLDLGIQEKAENALAGERSSSYLWKRHPNLQAALLAIDHKTGEILAMIGGVDYKSSQFNRTTQALRQPGSSFKPVVYSLALEKGSSWDRKLTVTPIDLPDYKPRGQEEMEGQEVTLLESFFRSLNSPAIQIGVELGIGELIQHGKKMGITSPIKREYGSILGGSETTLFEMAQVYGVMANGGLKVPLFGISRIENDRGQTLYERPPFEAERILTEETTLLMTEGLRQVLFQGTGQRAAALAPRAVGKTGTSDGSRDNWFCGYTPELTAVVWVGDDQFKALVEEAQGSSLALPIWEAFIRSTLPLKPRLSKE
jgi:penicillin-binding protein 1A